MRLLSLELLPRDSLVWSVSSSSRTVALLIARPLPTCPKVKTRPGLSSPSPHLPRSTISIVFLARVQWAELSPFLRQALVALAAVAFAHHDRPSDAHLTKNQLTSSALCLG